MHMECVTYESSTELTADMDRRRFDVSERSIVWNALESLDTNLKFQMLDGGVREGVRCCDVRRELSGRGPVRKTQAAADGAYCVS
jgi:hypothetical protein